MGGDAQTLIDTDEYIAKIVKEGDEDSKLLAALCAPTLRGKRYVQVLKGGMNGLAVLREVPKDYDVVVHSIGGDPEERDISRHASSMVDRLVRQAELIGAMPIGFADVIDANHGKEDLVRLIGGCLIERADHYSLPILNGEFAILGGRVNPEIQANVSGTMISLVKKGVLREGRDVITKDGNVYAVFDHEGKAIYINSDGIGTKTEFYERILKYYLGLGDSLAMKLDDLIKRGAKAKVVSDLVETRGRIPFDTIMNHSLDLARRLNILYILQREDLSSRIMGYNQASPSLNVSGSAVSLIDEERLSNPLKPSAGEYLVAIRGNPNPRSNGISDKRKRMVQLYGEDYQNTEMGRWFLEFLAEPSTILYPVFEKLIEMGLASSVYHMSGGAYDGKLSRPIAEHNLYANLKGLYPPDQRELFLSYLTSAQASYGKWPMGNEGVISTKDPEKAIRVIQDLGLEANVVARIEGPKIVEDKKEGRTKKMVGVELTAFNGENVSYLTEMKRAA